MNKMNVMELRHTIEYVSKKMKLASVQLDLIENDTSFSDNDLWLLASSILAVLNTEKSNIKEKFNIVQTVSPP